MSDNTQWCYFVYVIIFAPLFTPLFSLCSEKCINDHLYDELIAIKAGPPAVKDKR